MFSRRLAAGGRGEGGVGKAQAVLILNGKCGGATVMPVWLTRSGRSIDRGMPVRVRTGGTNTAWLCLLRGCVASCYGGSWRHASLPGSSEMPCSLLSSRRRTWRKLLAPFLASLDTYQQEGTLADQSHRGNATLLVCPITSQLRRLTRVACLSMTNHHCLRMKEKRNQAGKVHDARIRP